MGNQTNKSLEEESTTLKSEEQITKSITTPPTSLSKTNTVSIKNEKNLLPSSSQSIQKPKLPRTQKSTSRLRSSASTSNLNSRNSEKSFNKSVRNFFVRLSISLSLFASKIKFIAEEVLSSDEIESKIFYPTDSSSVASELYDDQNAEETTTTKTPRAMTRPEYPPDDIRNIGIDERAVELREEALLGGKPFSDGDKLWEIQNEQWLVPLEEYESINGRLKLEKKVADQELRHLVSQKDYSIVYNQLILKNKSLKKPMNLKDLLKVINAGWTANKTWERAAQGI